MSQDANARTRSTSGFKRSVSAGLAALLMSGFLVALPRAIAPVDAALPQYVDQRLNGDPACDQTHFPGGQLTTSTLRQEFVPSRAGVTGVDLCMQGLVSASVTLNVRAGTAALPGATLGTTTSTAVPGFAWVHFNLSSVANTTAGTKYVLEVPSFPANIYWRTDCGTTLSNCPSTTTDQYPAGTTNRTTQLTAKGDFGFRTYTPNAADLTGTISAPQVTCEGKAITGAAASVSNIASSAVGSFSAGIFLSTDQTITSADTVLGHVTLSSLGGNASQALTLPTLTIPSTWKEARSYLGLIVDENNTIVEQNETNNTAAAPTAVFCGHAGFASIGLTADQATIPAGSYRLPVDNIPLDAIGFAATGAEDAPVHNSPVHNSPVHNSPVHNSPIHNSLIGAPASVLENIHLSDIPTFLPGGWAAILNGTALAGKPEQDVTLADFLALSPAPNVTIGDLDIENSPLSVLTFAGVATAGASLNNLGAQVGSPAQDWCTFLSGQGYSCSSYGVTPSTSSLLDLNLLGVNAEIPWNTLPFKNMNLSGTPLNAVKLTQYHIRQSPAAQFLLSALNSPATFTTCTTCNTLGDAEAAGKIVDGPTFGDLIANLKTPAATLGTTTLGDYLLGAMAERDEWPVGALGLGRANLFAGTGQPVTYRGTVTAASGTGTAPLIDPQISVTLPPGYLVVPGTSQVIYPANTAARALGEPTVNGGKLTWQSSEIVTQGTTAQVVFKAAPSLDLGSAGSTVSAHAVDQFGSVDAAPLTNQAIVKVVDTETIAGQANDVATSAPYLESRVRRLGYISSSTDVDYYRIPVPTGAGCVLDPAATSPAISGCTITVTMSPEVADGSDFDLVLYGPADDPLTAPVHNSPVHNSPVHNSPVHNSPVHNSAADVPPETLNDSPVHNSPVHNSGVRDFSVQRATSEETVRTTTVGGEVGFFTLAVVGYNGSQSSHPYVASVTSAPPPALAPCTPRTYNAGSYTAAAPTVPSNFTTLIVVDENRMASIFGTSAVTGSGGLLDHLNTLAANSDGFIYPVEKNSAYASAMSAWDQNPCDVNLANTASKALSSLIASTVAGKSNFKYVVLVGSDEALPSYRMQDRTSLGNEINYTDSLVAAQGNTSITSAAASGSFLTDDIYATDEWQDGNGQPLFVPKWSVGRLVETPQEIDGSIDRFVTSNGQADLPPNQTALVAGYDFMADGAQGSVDGLTATLGSGKVGSLICENWTKQDLLANVVGPQSAQPSACLNQNAPTPPADIVGLFGHADNYRLLSAAGNATDSASELLTTADIGNLPPGRIVFSMGCHFGLNLPDSAVAPADANAARLADWAQTLSQRNAILVANSGYGYGDDVTVALSEKLMSQFASNLDGTRSVGQAFRDAKRSYYLSTFGTYGSYDQKALQEAIFYGLPMFSTSSTPGTIHSSSVQSISGSLSTDSTGLAEKAFDSGTLSFTPNSTANGTYYSYNGNVLVKDRRPIVPQVEYDVSNTDASYPGYKALGLFPTGVQTSVVSGNNPAFASAEYATGRPEAQSTGVFPTSPGAITSLDDVQHFLLWPARFTPTSATGVIPVTGDLALRNRVQGVMYYSNVEGNAPDIVQVTVQSPDSTHLSFQVRTSSPDAPVKRVGVMVGGVFGDLQQAGTDLYTGTIVVANSSQRSDVLVTAVSAAGVGYWADKGTPVATSSSNQGLTIKVCADGTTACAADGPTTNGWYPTAIRADVSGPVPAQAIDVIVDGQSGSNPAHVGTTGVHEIGASAYDSGSGQKLGAARTVLVDVDKPSAVITSPAATSYEINSVVTPASSCTDAGSGVQTCSGPASVDTSTLGSHTYTVTVADLAGNMNSVSVTYTVVDTGPPSVSITSPTATTYAAGSVVNAAYSCSDSGSGISTCVGSVANGDPIDMTIGTHTFSVTAMDKAGNQTTRQVTYTVADQQGPTITISSPTDGALYALNASVTASYSCADSSGVATCVGSVPSGTNLNTTQSGTFTFTVNATDTAGNSSTKSVTYKVALKFVGFQSPIMNPPTLNKVNAGNTTPFKFQVFNNGTELTDTTVFSFRWQTINCSSKADTVPDPLTQTTVSNPGFRWATGGFIYNAISDKSWGGYCRRFIVTMPDGSTAQAYIQFQKVLI